MSEKIQAEADRPITVFDNGKPETIPMSQAIIRSLGVAALKGDRRAAIEFNRLTDAAEARHRQERTETVALMLEYREKVLDIFAQYDAENMERPDVPTHPDDIVVDLMRQIIIINGPMGEIEKAEWAKRRAERQYAQEGVEYWEKYIRKNGPDSNAEQQIEFEKMIVRNMDTMFPDEETRRKPGFNLQKQRAEFLKVLLNEKKERTREARRLKREKSGPA